MLQKIVLHIRILIFVRSTLQLVRNIKPIGKLLCTDSSCSDLGIYLIYNIYKFHPIWRTFLDSLTHFTHFTHFTSLTSQPDIRGSTLLEYTVSPHRKPSVHIREWLLSTSCSHSFGRLRRYRQLECTVWAHRKPCFSLRFSLSFMLAFNVSQSHVSVPSIS